MPSAVTADAPRVSVITTVYNGERFLAEAIESILAQTYRDFEYLLVNDGSSDRSPQIISNYSAKDLRIATLHNPVKTNHSNAINTALKMAQGEFVAILDADDMASPERLERQVRFLDGHPPIGVVGAQVEQIDSTGEARHSMAFPTTCALSRWAIFFGTPVLHSAAMLRRSLLEQVGGYSVRWQYANDYSLWAELIGRTGVTNLSETLVAYRRHEQQTSSTRATAQQGEVWLLIFRMLAERLSLRVPLNDVGVLYQGVRGTHLEDAAALARASDLLAVIRERYLAVEQPDPAIVEDINADCARRLLTMAWVHRRSQRIASRGLLYRALEYDPKLWQRPQTWTQLRRLRSRHTARGKHS